MNPVLEAALGNRTAAWTLLFLAAYGEGHANRIGRTFGIAVSVVRDQLLRLEGEGALVSRHVGRSRVFEFNERNQRRGTSAVPSRRARPPHRGRSSTLFPTAPATTPHGQASVTSLNRGTTLEALAAAISQALEDAGVRATLSGGSVVSVAEEGRPAEDLDRLRERAKAKDSHRE